MFLIPIFAKLLTLSIVESIIKKVTDKSSEIVDTFIEPVKVRLSNHLFASFILAFITVNWKPVLYMFFSNSTIEDKFSHIKSNYYNSFSDDILFYFFIPLSISVCYTFGIPWVNNIINNINNRALKNRLEYEHRLILAEYDNKKVYAEKQSEIEERRANFKGIKDLNDKISFLNIELVEKDEQITHLVEELRSIKKYKVLEINKLKNNELINTNNSSDYLVILEFDEGLYENESFNSDDFYQKIKTVFSKYRIIINSAEMKDDSLVLYIGLEPKNRVIVQRAISELEGFSKYQILEQF